MTQSAHAEPLRIEVGAPTGVEISPDMWGLFIEDLNDALDGGLNAELVRNGDFEFSVADRPDWGPLTSWRHEGAGSVEVRTEDPVHANNAHYLRLIGPVALTNEGFDPIRAQEGQALRLTFASWSVSGHGDVSIAVVNTEGAELASASLTTQRGGWTWHEIDLIPSRSGHGELRFTVPEGLTFEIDVISLRPVGEDGKALTFRPDILAALVDLHPSFIRFPGGCVAHGLGLGNMYNWKPSIGARFEREQTFNLWGYHQSRQIGYLEYFELCQATGASPLPVVAAGVCCQNLRGRATAIPHEEMPAYIQDVLDLIEFANGGTDTVWGARRAELGHPEPFEMRYLGLGNEDEFTDDFRERYAAIADAVTEVYPEIVIIGTVGPQPFGDDFEQGWAYAREHDIAMVDEHAYRTPRWFHQNLDRYDSYSREESEVYFGEYAARTNRVRSALAEAAFMIAMERNADVVRLASYAPLLARIGRTQWVPDMIYFDSDRVLPSASYYVQQIFGRERGVRVHEVSLSGADPLSVTLAGSQEGTVRVSSPGAEVTFTQVVLDGVACADLTTSLEGEVAEVGEIAPSGSGSAAVPAVDLTFLATRTAGTEGFRIDLGGPEGLTAHYLQVEIGSWQNKATVVNVFVDGISDDIAGPTQWIGVRTGIPVEVRILLAGETVQVWVDGELRHEARQDARPEQRVVAGAASRVVVDASGEQRTEYMVRAVNATDVERAARIDLAGTTGEVSGELTVLAGAGPDEGAAFEESPVTPSSSAVGGTGGIDVVLPPWSFAVAVLR